MTVPATHCEAKLHGFRRTAEGVVVSFVLHPAEVPQALALDPLGTRYVLALCAIGDDETPIPSAGSLKPQPAKGTTEAGGDGPQSKPSTPAEGTPKTPGERAVIRAAILCGEPRFRVWLAGGGNISTDLAAMHLRAACEVESRAEIAKDPAALARFLQIETEYLIEIGAMARPR